VNALRRIILSEVPYVATYRDDARPASSAAGFVAKQNTGRLHNDILVDRIALVPIYLTRAEVDNFIPGSLTVELNVINRGSRRINVTSRNLQAKLFGKPHPNAAACFPPCAVTGDWPLITRLYPGERIEISSTLEKSCASKHAAFAVVSIASVQPALDEGAYLTKRREIEDNVDMDAGQKRIALNYHDTVTRKRLIDTGDVPGGDAVSHTLTVESECGLTGSEIIDAAEEVLVRKFTTSALSYESRVDGSSIFFTVSGQGHTFGSVLQDLCMTSRDKLGIASIGYFETHPLEDRIIVRVELPGGSAEAETTNAADLLAKLRVHCVRCIEQQVSFANRAAGSSQE
jgi:DNA-directed RNA polymerase subunit L